MNVPLNHEMQKIVEEKLRSGRYQTPEEVLQAGLITLEQQEMYGDFQPGEIDEFLDAGEHSIGPEGAIKIDDVFSQLEHRKARSRAKG